MKPTISDRELFDALRNAGHPGPEIQRVLHERSAWIKFRKEMRDEFAAQALQGLLASPRAPLDANGQERITAEHIAGLAYALADAMLVARG